MPKSIMIVVINDQRLKCGLVADEAKKALLSIEGVEVVLSNSVSDIGEGVFDVSKSGVKVSGLFSFDGSQDNRATSRT